MNSSPVADNDRLGLLSSEGADLLTSFRRLRLTFLSGPCVIGSHLIQFNYLKTSPTSLMISNFNPLCSVCITYDLDPCICIEILWIRIRSTC